MCAQQRLDCSLSDANCLGKIPQPDCQKRVNTSRPLLSRRGRGHGHAMTPEDVRHLRTVGRAAGGGTDYFGSFAEVRRTHDRRSYDRQLCHILAAEVIEAVHRASGDAQRLPGTNLNGGAVNRPGKAPLIPWRISS
jgi:hypothetical protein